MTILVLCSKPECQTSAGCKCGNVLTFDGRGRYRGEPTIVIEFSTHGAFARKQWPNGAYEDISITDAMRAFDRLQREQ